MMLWATTAHAQSTNTQAPGPAGSLPAIVGPPAPLPPAMVSRDAQGRATMRAVRVDKPMLIDGQLDEAVYERVPAVGDFIQQDPLEGEPATEKTEVWVFFDDKNLYVGARCWDSHPERMVANEMRRDNQSISSNENFTVSLDTFYDRRTGFAFQTTPLGAMKDQLVSGEGSPNENWNAVWYTRAGRFEHGWTTEIAIPFKSLRYPGSGPQVWSVTFRRLVRWKNEYSYLTRVPRAYGGAGAFQFAVAGTLVGVETPRQTVNFEVKPYGLASVTTDRTLATPITNDPKAAGGVDVKYGITRGLIADFTYNTDSSQVEVDEQQVNLTRFSLFFPEKRDFFLEGQGIFAFGGAPLNVPNSSNFSGGQGTGGTSTSSYAPILFFSRRIGLAQDTGQPLPILLGERVAGKAGRFSIGGLNIRTGDDPSLHAVATDFSVLRLKRDIFRRSSVGMIVTRRSPALATSEANLSLGLDAGLAFYQNLYINGYYAKTRTDGVRDGDASYRGQFDYRADRYGVMVEHLLVGDHFNPEVGFVKRDNFRQTLTTLRFSPRPTRIRIVRKFTYQADLNYMTDPGGSTLQTRDATGTFKTEFQNGDGLTAQYTNSVDAPQANFALSNGVVIPAGRYDFQSANASYFLGQQHKVSGTAKIGRGSYYGGDKTEASFTGRVQLTRTMLVEPNLSWNWLNLPQGKFVTRLVTARTSFAPTARAVLSALLQYNSATNTASANVRFKWEYIPGSELFVVYSEGRMTDVASGLPSLQSRGFVVKVTRMLRL